MKIVLEIFGILLIIVGAYLKKPLNITRKTENIAWILIGAGLLLTVLSALPM